MDHHQIRIQTDAPSPDSREQPWHSCTGASGRWRRPVARIGLAGVLWIVEEDSGLQFNGSIILVHPYHLADAPAREWMLLRLSQFDLARNFVPHFERMRVQLKKQTASTYIQRHGPIFFVFVGAPHDGLRTYLKPGLPTSVSRIICHVDSSPIWLDSKTCISAVLETDRNRDLQITCSLLARPLEEDNVLGK